MVKVVKSQPADHSTICVKALKVQYEGYSPLTM